MGNCVCIKETTMEEQVDQLFSSCSPGHNKIRLVISKEGEVLFLANPSTAVVDPVSQKTGRKNDCGTVRKIKLVVTKKQLAEMLFKHGVKEFESANGFAFQVMESCQARERRRKWQPALATIPE